MDFDDTHAAIECLERAGLAVTPRRVRSMAEFDDALAQDRWEAVVADLEHSEFAGVDALRQFVAARLDIPFVVVSTVFMPEIGIRAIKEGASDYFLKSQMAMLAEVLKHEITGPSSRVSQRESQRNLIESEERFRSLTALSSDWYWEQDEGLRFTYVSAALRDRYSEALESWAGKTRWELPYCDADWTAHRASVEARESFHDVELQPFRHDGSITYICVSGEPKFNRSGRFVGYRGIGRDITERVKDAEALRRFRTAMDATPDAITLVSRTSLKFVEVNATAAQMLNYTRAELLRLGPTSVSDISREDIERAYDSMIIGDRTYETTQTLLRRKDGSTFHVDVRQHAQRIGSDWLIVGVVRDRTEQTQAEDTLRRLNRLYKMVSATNALVVRVRDRDELFNSACNIAVEHGEFEQGWVGIIDPTDKTIVPMAFAGLSDEAITSIKLLYSSAGSVLQGKTLAARAMTGKTAVVSNDVQNNTELVFGKRYAETGIHSLAMLPLIVSDQAIGVFGLYTSQPEFFDTEGLMLLTELANNIAFALDHLGKQERLDYLAYYDELTGLANRNLFLDRLTQSMRSASSGGYRLALLLIDLERFKKINDTLGRSTGDSLLQLVAQWLAENAADVSALARVDADHFAVVLPEVTHEAETARILEKILKAFLVHPFRLKNVDYRLAAKVGVALFPDDGTDADTLFRNAEVAVKKAKVGGDRYLFYAQKMTETVAGSLGLENRLRQALERDEFVLHYQPKVNIATGLLTGAEALLRWNDPQSGLVPPGRFITILEETGLIHEVGSWALRQAIDDYRRWRQAGHATVRIAVNVSPLQLRNRSFVAELEQAIGDAPDAAAGLELELTETLIMEDVAKSIGSLLAIRSLGVTIAIDDFGTGFSSLSYLSKLPVDTLKIDRSFVTEMVSNADGRTLVSVIIGLAHALKLKVVAEGVETEAQLRELRLLHCDEMQGYLFGKPVPADVFANLYLSGEPA